MPGGQPKHRGTRRYRPVARLDLRKHANAMQLALVHHHPTHATLPKALETGLCGKGTFLSGSMRTF
jgi:hypothetical protein